MTTGDTKHEREPVERLTVWVSGHVQGVGFRWWTRARALEYGLRGWALNRPDGRVEVVAEGPREALEALLAVLQPPPTGAMDPGAGAGGRSRPGAVDAAVAAWSAAKDLPPGFVER